MHDANWSYHIINPTSHTVEYLNDIDCMAINFFDKTRNKNPKIGPFFQLVDFTLDLDNMLAFCGHKRMYRLMVKQTKFNDRTRSTRSSRKNDGIQFKLKSIKNKFAEGRCETGMRWAVLYNGQQTGLSVE